MAKNRDRQPKFTALPDDQRPDLQSVSSIISSAKIAASKAMSVCAPAIRALQPVILPESSGLGTFATDKYYRMYVCEGAVRQWVEAAEAVSPENPCGTCGNISHHPIAYIGGAICHEAWHPLRQHYTRSEEFGVTDHQRWNIAGDEEINDDLLEIFKHCDMPRLCIIPSHCYTPESQEHEPGKLAEHYYMKLQSSGKKFGNHTCGSGADGKSKPWDKGEPGEGNKTPGISEAEGRMIRKDVANNIKKESQTRGNMPGGFAIWADMQLEPPKYDWRQEMAKAARWCVQRAQGDEERSYRRLGRRCASLNYKAIVPSTYKPVPLVKIVQDTSGSMGGGQSDAMKTSLNEGEGVIKATGARVVFVSCDVQADKQQSVDSIKNVQLHGGGGTDMREGIKAALEGEMPNLIVLFTDGHTPWPEEPIMNGRVRLLVCLVGQHACDVNDPPPWATVVKIVGDDVEKKEAS